jgi:hypothetical protein
MITVYTAALGGKNPPNRPISPKREALYLCYTDTPQKVMPPWQPVYFDWSSISNSPTKATAIIKVCSHLYAPGDSMWVDPHLTVLNTPADLTQVTTGVGTHRHKGFKCVFAYIDYLFENGLETRSLLEWFTKHLLIIAYPTVARFDDTSVILRTGTPEVAVFNEKWLSLLERFANEQLTFNLANWNDKPVQHTVLPGFVDDAIQTSSSPYAVAQPS